MSDTDPHGRILRCTAQIAAAHASHTPMTPNGLVALIRSVHATLAGLVSGAPAGIHAPGAATAAGKPVPAVPVRKSIHRDYLISLEDGTRVKMLKRHLATSYGMTPEQYRTKWGLPPDYPMVAPAYAERRSTLAKESGLGRKPKGASEPSPHDAEALAPPGGDPSGDGPSDDAPPSEAASDAAPAGHEAGDGDTAPEAATAPQAGSRQAGSRQAGSRTAGSKAEGRNAGSPPAPAQAARAHADAKQAAAEQADTGQSGAGAVASGTDTGGPDASETAAGRFDAGSDEPDAGPRVAHTAESVFANFRPSHDEAADGPDEAAVAAAKADLARPDPAKRKRFAQQAARQMPRKQGSTPP